MKSIKILPWNQQKNVIWTGKRPTIKDLLNVFPKDIDYIIYLIITILVKIYYIIFGYTIQISNDSNSYEI